ncbi:MAG: DegT/DnrJ/EryC1/StrS family aminotransferase [Candidatus Omnitrophota bacterium]|nr:DegT/DnrJ/EryC1/StrS family aminotransferase [Candidatus Omnitrophota bacterium]MDZ4242988.1 DegT/DnrJ/EryC1/StrS family aminotransferase [Candidatus Omnitrophota bacterium]
MSRNKTPEKLEIPFARPSFAGKEKEYLADALSSTWVSGGPYVEKFEESFAAFHGMPYAVMTSSGTAALHLALLGCGIGPGDEVIVPGLTFVAPINMVIAAGARPVFADVDPRTWCVDPASVSALISDRTRAVIAVHLYGNVCDMARLSEIASRHSLLLLEDAAEAVFSRDHGQYAGTFGDAGCFSFQATKTITTGEGGCVLTRRPELYEEMRILRDHGMTPGKRYWHEAVGYNFRLTNLQAAVGCGQMDDLERIVARRRNIHRLYRSSLEGETGLTLQHFSSSVDPVIWALGVKIDAAVFPQGRDALIQALAAEGIETRPGFYPASVLPVYAAAPLPAAEDIGKSVIVLPCFPGLGDGEVEAVCAGLKGLRKGLS